MKSREIIPLFPLQKVLFPKMILPLHIFEERYKEMIAACTAGDTVFGVVHSDDLQPGAIGTTARVQKVLRTYDDGRMDLLASGEERFRVLSLIEDRAYLRAEIESLDDTPNEEITQGALEDMVTMYRSFIARLGLETQQRQQLEELVVELEGEREISYVIGQTIGLDTSGQLDLLAERSPQARIRKLTEELKRHEVIHHVARDLFEGDDFDPTLN